MSMKDYPEEIVSIVRKISSAEDLQSFFETLSGKPAADAKTAYDLYYKMVEDVTGYNAETVAASRIARLPVSPAVSYLNANYAAIADTVKDQGAYGKGIAEGLLSDSRTLVRNATDMKDILAAFKYAFQAGSVIADAVRQLDDIASAFRAGERKLPDIFAIVRTVESAPWAVQKVFLEAEQNADIADLVRQAHTREFERQIFEDRVAAGGELFRKTGFTDRVEELQDVVQELAQAEEEYIAAQARFCDYRGLKRADLAEATMPKSFQELRNRIDLLEKKKEEIFQEIKEKMIKQSSISHADAMKWVKNNVTFKESASKMILSRWYNIVKPSFSDGKKRTIDTVKEELDSVCRNTNDILGKIKSELADIYRLTNGQINHVTINLAELSMSYDRAMACKEGNTIILPKADFGALYHEAGHIFEYENPCFLGPALLFLRDRCTDGLQELADLVKKAELAKKPVYDDDDPDYSDEDDDESYYSDEDDDDDDESYYSDYGEDELAFSGRFSHPSVGRLYAGATEVLSCGLGIFGDAERFLRGIEDMEHLKFCFGCFASGPANCIEVPDEDGIIKKAGFAGKTAAWTEALDNAMPDSFAENLFTQEGVACFQIVEKVTLAQEGFPFRHVSDRGLITAKVLKCCDSVIAQKNDSDDAFKKLARIAYLGICNSDELIPDACWPISNGDYLDKLSCNPPKWYTPITKLPRL